MSAQRRSRVPLCLYPEGREAGFTVAPNTWSPFPKAPKSLLWCHVNTSLHYTNNEPDVGQMLHMWHLPLLFGQTTRGQTGKLTATDVSLDSNTNRFLLRTKYQPIINQTQLQDQVD